MEKKSLKETISNTIYDFLSTEFNVDIVVNKLVSYLDIKKLLNENQILIEEDQGKIIISGTDGDCNQSTDVIDTESDGWSSDGENEKVIISICKLANIIRYRLGLDNSKYADYRFECGLLPNSDKAIEELDKIIDYETRNKLYEEGYEIIKRHD